MSGLVELLETQGEALLAACRRRLGDDTLLARVHERLDALRVALVAGRIGSGRGAVPEVSVLRDCIFELLAAQGVSPDLQEQRVMAEWSAAVIGDTAARGADEPLLPFDLFQQAPGFMCFLRGPELVFELANSAYYQLVGHREILGKPVREALPELAGQGYFELLDRVYGTGEPFVGRGMRVKLQQEPGAPIHEAFLDLTYQPIRGADGHVTGILALATTSRCTSTRRRAACRRRRPCASRRSATAACSSRSTTATACCR